MDKSDTPIVHQFQLPLAVSSQNRMTPAPIGPPSAHLAVHQSQESYFHICCVHVQIRLALKSKDNHEFTGQAQDKNRAEPQKYLAASTRMSSFKRASICSTLSLLIP